MDQRPREPALAELAAAAKGHTTPDRAMLARAAAGRDAINSGADPVLTLGLVVWPSERVKAAQASARSSPARREASTLHRVQVDVAGKIVEITWDECDALLNKLRTVAGCEKVVQRFEAVGASRPVELNDDRRSRLRVALVVWESGSVLPDGLARLLVALVQADPSGEVGTAFFGKTD